MVFELAIREMMEGVIMKMLFLLMAFFALFLGLMPWITSDPDPWALSIFGFYISGLMFWAFFRNGKSRSSEEWAALFWPVLFIAVSIMFLIFRIEELRNHYH